MTSHGGYRKGAGRPAGSKSRADADDTKNLSEIARSHTEQAIYTLVDITKNGRTDAARVSAANAILDRGYGKPPVKDSLEPKTIPPMIIELVACHTNKSEKANKKPDTK